MSRSASGGTWRGVLVRPAACLDRGGELVEGEVFGAADLEYAAAGRGVGHDMFDQRGDVGNGDEVDRVVPPSEDDGGRPERAALWLSTPIHSSKNAVARTIVQRTPLARRCSSAACFIRNELHRAVRCGAGDRHQNKLSARRSCGIDQVDVALVVDRGRGHAPGPGEPVDRGHDHVGTFDALCQAERDHRNMSTIPRYIFPRRES